MKPSNSGCLVSLLERVTFALAIICWLLVPGIVIVPFAAATWGSAPDPGRISFPASLDPDSLQLEAEGPTGTWTICPYQAQIDAPVDAWWKASLVLMPIFALMAFVATQLSRMFRTLRDGHPFTPENARRIRRIGMGVLAFEGLRMVLTTTLLGPALRSLQGEHAIRAGPGVDLGNVFVALSVLAFAEVFRRGTEIQAEQDLTV